MKRMFALLLALLFVLGASCALADMQDMTGTGDLRFSIAVDGNFGDFTTNTDQDYASGGVIEIVCPCGGEHAVNGLTTSYSITPHADCPYTLKIHGSLPVLTDNPEGGPARFQENFTIDCIMPDSLPVPAGEYSFTIRAEAACKSTGASGIAEYTVELIVTEGGALPPSFYGMSIDDLLRSIRYAPDTVYQQGNLCDAVRFIQTALTELGHYDATISGNYGGNTVAAVERFQAAEGLPVTGKCDAATMIRLFRLYLGDVEITYAPGYENLHQTNDAHRFDSLGLTAGAAARLIDLWTDVSMDVVITNSDGHIDAVPASSAAVRALCRLYAVDDASGIGSDPRPMLLIVSGDGGDTQVICSMSVRQGASGDPQSAVFDGQLCLYLTASDDHHASAAQHDHAGTLVKAANLMASKRGRTVGVGSIVKDESSFENMPPVETPTLVLPNGGTQDASPMLKYDMPVHGNGTITYNVHMSDLKGEQLNLLKESTLCFPYPEGLDQSSARKYRIIIHHQISGKETEVFKSEDGDIEFAPQGLCIRVRSFSPFVITWAPDADALPQTGDNASLPLWLALLGACSVILLPRRRRANR